MGMTKKTVWLINEGENLPGDDNNPRLQRMGLLAYEVAKLDGVEVVWWQSTFNHYQKKFRCREDKAVRLADNLKLIMLHSFGYRKNVCLRRLAHEWKTARRFYTLAQREPRPDVMVAAMPTIALAHYAVKFGRERGIPVLVDLRDLNPDVFVAPFSGAVRLCVRMGIEPLRWVLAKALRHADGLIGTTEPYLSWGLRYAKRTRGDNDRVFFVSYTDSGVPTRLVNEARWGKYMDYEGIVVCYFGQFGRLMDFDTVIDAAELCQRNGVRARFLLCGEGELLERCRGRVRERGLKNVELPGWVNKTDIADIGYVADAGLMAYRDDDNFNMQMPNKFSEYLSLRLAILLQPTGVMERVTADHQCGMRYGNARELYEAVKGLAEDRERLELYKRNARAVFEKYFSVERIYKEYAEYIIKNAKK